MPSVKSHFEKSNPDVRATYDAILKAARMLGAVREEAKKTSIHLMRATTFAGVTVRREALILTFKSSEPIESERVHNALHASVNRWYNEIRVASPHEVDRELREWIMASYALAGKPRRPSAMPSGHTTIDEYLQRLTPDKRAALQRLRHDIHAAVSGAEECISYQLPAFRKDGRVFICFGAGANHLSIYPGAAPIKALTNELKNYETSKGTVRFPIGKPLPAALIRKILKIGLSAPMMSKKPVARPRSKKRRG